MDRERNAWTSYWSAGVSSAGGCLPGLPGSVSDFFEKKWCFFFDHLPQGVRLLDMGTGSGAVLRLAMKHRPDLCLTGVDYAEHLPDLGPGFTLHPGTSMESLPFADDSFAGIIGQFSVEYGAVTRVAMEIRRVLQGGGRYAFICHHAAGIIVHDNLARLVALKAVLAHGGLVETAIKAVRQKKKNRPATRQCLARLFEAHRNRCPGQSLVDEVGHDIAHIMTQKNSLKELLRVRRDLRHEGYRIEALGKAALDENGAHHLADLLPPPPHGGKNLVESLSVPGVAAPLAWLITNLL
ncbi:MAG: class I SAM-dependent methyltransferase [Desulfocapsa sp.]|nr:class I SAM-dependent methyltransferase [Desulfocapsa sp.]